MTAETPNRLRKLPWWSFLRGQKRRIEANFGRPWYYHDVTPTAHGIIHHSTCWCWARGHRG